MTIYETGVGAIKMWLKNGMKPASNIEFTAGELRNLAWEIEQAKAAWIEAARKKLAERVKTYFISVPDKDATYKNAVADAIMRIEKEFNAVFGCDSAKEGSHGPHGTSPSKAQEPREGKGVGK